jgi:hypothetical protein
MVVSSDGQESLRPIDINLEPACVVRDVGGAEEVLDEVGLSVTSSFSAAIIEGVQAVEGVQGDGVLPEHPLELLLPTPLRAVWHLLGDGKNARPARVQDISSQGLGMAILRRLGEPDLGKRITGMPIAIRLGHPVRATVELVPVVGHSPGHLYHPKLLFSASAAFWAFCLSE